MILLTDLRKKTSVSNYDDIVRKVDEELTPEMKQADENIAFEKHVIEEPIPPGVGRVDAFGETWDINSMLKGNYWGRTIYTTDEICKMFLKWTIEKQKKYLQKRNPLGFNYAWLLLLMIGGIAAILFIVFLLPRLGAGV